MDMLSPRWFWEIGAAEESTNCKFPHIQEQRRQGLPVSAHSGQLSLSSSKSPSQMTSMEPWLAGSQKKEVLVFPSAPFFLGGVSEVDLQPRELEQVLVGAPCWGLIRRLCSQHRFPA